MNTGELIQGNQYRIAKWIKVSRKRSTNKRRIGNK